MSRRISKRIRAMAIRALEFTCSDVQWYSSRRHIQDHVSGDALELAESALDEVPIPIWTQNTDHFREELMEAAGLLRDGWCPGDEVVVLCHADTSRSPS